MCVATSSAVCSASETTVPFDPMNPQVAEVRVSVHNASAACGNITIAFTLQVQQIDPFMDALNVQWMGLFGVPGGVQIPPVSSHSDTLQVTLPAGAPKGDRLFRVTIAPVTPGDFPIVECIAKVIVGDVIRVEEVNGHLCTPAGVIATKAFQVTNLTGVTRTVNFTATSTQTSSAPTGAPQDHFPVAFCGQALVGNPADPVPPTVTGTLTLAPNQMQTVCIDTMSFPQCEAGSNCHLDMAVTDVATGCVARAASDTTVVLPGWNKNGGSPISSVGVPALGPLGAGLLALLVGGAGFAMTRRRT